MPDQKLTEEELKNITGGTGPDDGDGSQGEIRTCPECGENAVQTPMYGGRYKCSACGITYTPLLGFNI